MKLMIASDMHGSAMYCQKLIDVYKKECADKLLILGDILYHGPRNDLPNEYAPKEVIAMLNGISDELLCVRGNCDTEVDQMVLDFPIMADYCILWLKDKMIFATHGHKFGKDNIPNIKSGDILLCGHTHIPAFENIGKMSEILYVNPGSVSIPKENSPHSYMILENETFLWKDLESMSVYREEEI